jgi:hypothetical protein
MISDNTKGNKYHDSKGRFASASGTKAEPTQGIKEVEYNNKLKGVIDILESYRGKSEGTYDFLTGEPVNLTDGYMVTFHRNEADENGHYKSHFGRYTPEEYDEEARKFALENDAEVFIGVYDNEPEISFKVKTREQAQELMIKYNQKSYWDNAQGKAYDNTVPPYDKKDNPMQGD